MTDDREHDEGTDYERARAALDNWDYALEHFDAEHAYRVALLAILDLHKPYWSVPEEICDDAILTERGLAEDAWREPTEFEKITSGRWWCDGCRSDVSENPCATARIVLSAVLPSSSPGSTG